MGIGRPSTYAAIISTIQDRGYVKREKRAFYATELGTLVTEKLIEHFPKIMDVKFTSHMEDELDKIEDGKIVWLDVLKEFYEPFKNDLERAVGEMKSVKGLLKKAQRYVPSVDNQWLFDGENTENSWVVQHFPNAKARFPWMKGRTCRSRDH